MKTQRWQWQQFVCYKEKKLHLLNGAFVLQILNFLKTKVLPGIWSSRHRDVTIFYLQSKTCPAGWCRKGFKIQSCKRSKKLPQWLQKFWFHNTHLKRCCCSSWCSSSLDVVLVLSWLISRSQYIMINKSNMNEIVPNTCIGVWEIGQRSSKYSIRCGWPANKWACIFGYEMTFVTIIWS